MAGKGGLYNPRPVDDVPVNGQLQHGVTSNWAFDHAAGVDSHVPEMLPYLLANGHLIYIPSTPTWSSALANGAAALVSQILTGVDTNAGANASGIVYSYVAGLRLGGVNAERIDWDKKLWVRFGMFTRDLGGNHTNSIYRVQLKESIAEGALAAKGIGIRIDGIAAAPQDLFAESYGTGLVATDTTYDVTSYESNWIDIIHTPATSIVYRVDGVIVRTETTANNIPAGIAGASCAFTVSAVNGASSGDGRMYVHSIFIWQEV